MPSITPKKLLRFLKERDFYIHHQVGSHIVLKSRKEAAKRVTLPIHNKDLKPGTFGSILKQAGIEKIELFR